jgi:SAM-dependent methyltransferase
MGLRGAAVSAMSARLDPRTLLNAVHNAAVFNRRVRVLAGHLAAKIPQRGRVLDVGAGDGQVAAAVMALRPDLSFEGVDVLIRPVTHIPVTKYDGDTLPFADRAFDYVTVVDVLHHTFDPARVLAEARRVATRGVVVKDHLGDGFLGRPTLRFMDWVGNFGHGVVLPYNYLSRAQWDAVFGRVGLRPASWTERLALYPRPASWVFDRHLHFVALLEPEGR